MWPTHLADILQNRLYEAEVPDVEGWQRQPHMAEVTAAVLQGLRACLAFGCLARRAL